MKRKPVVAGRFYEEDPDRLRQQVEEYTIPSAKRSRAIGAMVPHAGLMYSGPVAGMVYSELEAPGAFVLIGPNHTGHGARLAIMEKGSWEIPTGSVEIDTALADEIMRHGCDLELDTEAHMMEHSLEVQLPFIAHHFPEAKIVPISIMSASLEGACALGRGIAEVVKGYGKAVTLIASSDMSHFISDKAARDKDRMAIDKVLALDPEGLYDTVRSQDITMCGMLPTVVMLQASIALGAKEARLVHYTTSAEVSGDYNSVVGYAGVVVF